MKYIFSIPLALFLWCCSPTTDTTNFTNNSTNSKKKFKHVEELNSLVDTFLMDTLMNSLSIGIYHKGEEFTHHYGEIDPGKNNRPDNNTIYDIGSVTKTFVGTLIATAELEGKLSLEDDVRKYLDGAYPNLEYEKEPLRIKHLITHSARLPMHVPESIMDEFQVIDAELPVRVSKLTMAYSKEQFFDDLKRMQIDTFPGFNYAYSGAGVELACHIIERVYGMPFEKVLEEKIFSKANMTSTKINLAAADMESYATGYGDYKNATPPMRTKLWGGSGYGKSTIPDLLNYIKYQLNKSDKAVQRSHDILFDKAIIDGDPRNKMGFLWQVSTDRDFGVYIKHHGGAYGVQNFMLIYPEEELGITIITNQSGWHTAGKLLYVVNGVLDEIAKEN